MNRDSFIGFGRLLFREAAADSLITIEGLKVTLSLNAQTAKAMGSAGPFNLPRRIDITQAEPQFQLATNRYNDTIALIANQLDGATVLGKSVNCENCEIQLWDNEDDVDSGAPSIKYTGIYGKIGCESQEFGRDQHIESTITIDLITPMPTMTTENLSDNPPTITGIAPTTGTEDDAIVITGTNFFENQVVGVMVGSALTPMAFHRDSDTQITAYIPPAGVTGTIRVVTLHGAATSGDTLTIS